MKRLQGTERFQIHHITKNCAKINDAILDSMSRQTLTSNLEKTNSGIMTRLMGSSRPSLVVRGTRKKAKNHHLVILGIPAIQLEISFCASILATCSNDEELVREKPPVGAHLLEMYRLAAAPTYNFLIGQHLIPPRASHKHLVPVSVLLV